MVEVDSDSIWMNSIWIFKNCFRPLMDCILRFRPDLFPILVGHLWSFHWIPLFLVELPLDREDGDSVMFLSGLCRLQQSETDPLLRAVPLHSAQQSTWRRPHLPLQPAFGLGHGPRNAELYYRNRRQVRAFYLLNEPLEGYWNELHKPTAVQ